MHCSAMKKINVITLGCSKNTVDSEHLMAQLEAAGYTVAADSDRTDAKVVVINTCGFIGDAKQESIDMILRAAAAKQAGRIERLLFNLLSNAFKFIGRGEKRVAVDVRVEPDYVYLTVSDTGVGIPSEMLDTVFDRARQPDRLDPPPHGLGLGLPICRRVAREHGGSLALSSEEGRGTTVTVSLPNRRGPQRVGANEGICVSPGFNMTLVELADALPRQAFTQKYLD